MTVAAAELGLARLADRTVLSTFGLISASKGLELMIRALPPVVAARPDVLYLIAGQTHPEVVKHEGESYRLGLERLVHELGLGEHVCFVDRFLSVDELAVLLARTDLYVTPYRSPEQIVSGALTFAVAAGCPVVSTPYHYAENLLGSGAGVLVPFGDVPRLSAAVLDLLDSPGKLDAARAEARRVGADLPWASVGKVTLEVLAEAVDDIGPSPRRAPAGPDRPTAARSPTICCGWSTTSASSSTPTAPCRTGRPATASTTWPGWPSSPCTWAERSTTPRYATHPGLVAGLPGPRLGAGAPRHAQLHGLRPALAGRTAPRRPSRPGRLGAGRGGRRSSPARPEARASLRLLTEMAPALDRLTTPRELAFTLLGLTRPDLDTLPESLRIAVRTLAERLAGWYDEHRRDGWELVRGRADATTTPGCPRR